MSIKIYINSTEVSDYVVSCDAVPFVTRNRNYEPEFAGFEMSVSTEYANTISIDELVHVANDTTFFYLGYVKRKKLDYENSVNVITVENYLFKLNEYSLTYAVLHSQLLDFIGTGGGKTFTVNVGGSLILCTGHGLSINDRIVFKTSGGTLPPPIIEKRIYSVIATDFTADQFRCQYYEDGSASYLTLSGSGSGTNKFYPANLDLYSNFDGADSLIGNGYPLIQYAWLVKKMFDLIGVTLVTAELDLYYLYSKVISALEYQFSWEHLKLDENMLYCLNQSVATEHQTLDIDTEKTYGENKITLKDFIIQTFGFFGINTRFTGNLSSVEYTLGGQSRNATTGEVTPDNDVYYDIADDDKYSYEAENIPAENTGYSYSIYYNDGRDHYQAPGASALTEYEKKYEGVHAKDVSGFKNLLFLLKDLSGGAGDDDLFTETLPAPNMLANRLNEILYDFNYEKIIAPIQLTNYLVKEELINVGEVQSEIIQETNTLT